jgi:epoxyqueuosine reductase
MEDLIKNLHTEFEKYNVKFRIVSTDHLKELKEDIEELRRDGGITEEFYLENLSFFQFEKPDVLQSAQSIIVIAIPQGITVVTFKVDGKNHDVVIPPTYIYEDIRNTCKDILGRIPGEADRKIVRTALPLKLLAVRSGLGRYGKNNICYVEGMGSFHRLEAFYTSYPFGIDSWQKVEMMDICSSCLLCMEDCPTQAIPAERVLIDAQRCLTHFNEDVGEFPEWINTQSHNALVGCMRCQIICPENQQFINMINRREMFSEEETEIILKGTEKGNLPGDLYSKLKRLNMERYYLVLSRNLSALLS